jgi:hypothetical protein
MFGKIASGIAFLFLPLLANAQGSPAPIGSWATKPASEQLFVSANGCKFTATNGKTTIVQEGQCSWNPSSAGGILTIMNIHFYQPAPVYYNIVWVNSKQIKVEGDVFYKQD